MFEEGEEEDTYVSWNPSVDPALPDGSLGSGIGMYSYRYRLEGSSWSSWATTPNAGFGIAGTRDGEEIDVSVLAEDQEGNSSPIRHAVLTTTPPVLTEEDMGEEDPFEPTGGDEIVPEPEHHNPAEEEAEAGTSPLVSPLAASGDEPCAGEEDPCGRFNWKAARAYTERWLLNGKSNEYVAEHHNPQFQYFGEAGGDCTNFASQILWAGNMQFMRTNGHDSPDIDSNGEDHFGDYQYGQGSWWSGYYYYYPEEPSIGPKLYRRPTESWDNAHKLFEHLVEYGLIAPVNGRPLRAGDLIFYDLYHGASIEHIDHTQVIERVTHRRIYVAQHSPAFARTLRHEFTHVRNKYGVRGVDWEMWIMRPVHTKANL